MVIELQDQITTLSGQLTEAEKRYDAVVSDYTSRTTTGDAALDDSIRKAVEEHLTPNLRAVETETVDISNTITTSARELLIEIQNPPIAPDRNTEAVADVSYERIRDRTQNLSFEELVKSVRGAIRSDNRPYLWNYYELIPARIKAESSGLSARERAARQELTELRTEIGELFRDRSGKKHEDAVVDLLKRSSNLRQRAGANARADALKKKRYSFQMPNDVVWRRDG